MPLSYWMLASAGLHVLAFTAWALFSPTPPAAGVEAGPSTMVIRAIISAPEREETDAKPEQDEVTPAPDAVLVAAETKPQEPDPVAPEPVDATPQPEIHQTGAEHDRPATAIVNPAPGYPEPARRAGLEGTVEAIVHINAQGRVISVDLANSSGHRLLDDSALQTLQNWRFEPARMGGIAVGSTARQRFVFQLEES